MSAIRAAGGTTVEIAWHADEKRVHGVIATMTPKRARELRDALTSALAELEGRAERGHCRGDGCAVDLEGGNLYTTAPPAETQSEPANVQLDPFEGHG